MGERDSLITLAYLERQTFYRQTDRLSLQHGTRVEANRAPKTPRAHPREIGDMVLQEAQ